jgi:hypothetical protein
MSITDGLVLYGSMAVCFIGFLENGFLNRFMVLERGENERRVKEEKKARA